MEKIGFQNTVHMVHRNAAGEILSEQTTHNLIVNEGRQFLLDQAFGSGVNKPMKYIALSSATETITKAMTALAYEITLYNLGRAAGAYTLDGTNKGLCTVVLQFTASGNSGAQTVTGAGLFDQASASGDKMMAAANFGTGVSMNSGDDVTVTWTIDEGYTD